MLTALSYFNTTRKLRKTLKMFGVKSEFSDSLICRGCLSTDRKLSPLTNYDLYFALLKKHSTDDLKYYNILLCWECRARLRSTAVFQKQLQDAQCALSLAYNKFALESLSPLKFIHKQDYDCSIEETTDTKPDFTFIDNCEAVDIKHEDIVIDYDDFENEVLNYSENEVKVEKGIKKRKSKDKRIREKRTIKERHQLKKIEIGIDFKNLDFYFSKVCLNEMEVEESLARERSDEDSISRPYKCSVCGFRFASKRLLWWHKREDHKKRSITAKCRHCTSAYSFRADLLMHWRRLHPVNRCLFCQLVVERDEDREKHLKQHLFRYNCLKCGAEFMDKLSFRHHERELHTNYVCDHCGLKISKKKSLEVHIRNQHLPNACAACGEVYDSRVRLLRHMIVHKNQHLPNRCPTCGQVFATRQGLLRHTEIHKQVPKEWSYCVECDVTFASRQRYNRHLRYTKRHAPSSQKKVSIPCPECGKIFSRKTYMNNHVRLFHSNDSKHHCAICDKSFVNGFALRQHKKYVHEKKPVPKTKMCKICGRGFGSNRVLENHMRTHTGERPFACDRCSSAFAQRVALRAHRAAVHKIK